MSWTRTSLGSRADTSGTTGGHPVAIGAAVNVGDLVAVLATVAGGGAATLTCADDGGNTYTGAQITGTGLNTWFFYAIATSSVSNGGNVTVSLGSSATMEIVIDKWVCSTGAPSFDVSATASGSGTAAASGATATVAGGAELVLGAMTGRNTNAAFVFTPGTSYAADTSIVPQVGAAFYLVALEDQQPANASGTFNAGTTLSQSTNASWTAQTFVFKPGVVTSPVSLGIRVNQAVKRASYF